MVSVYCSLSLLPPVISPLVSFLRACPLNKPLQGLCESPDKRPCLRRDHSAIQAHQEMSLLFSRNAINRLC